MSLLGPIVEKAPWEYHLFKESLKPETILRMSKQLRCICKIVPETCLSVRSVSNNAFVSARQVLTMVDFVCSTHSRSVIIYEY